MAFCRPPILVLLILLLALTGLTATAVAEEPRGGPPVPLGPAGVSSPLDLAQCLQLGLQRHPRVAAQRAGLAAAEDGIRALEALSAPPILVPDLPVRRKQAALGKAAAVAALDEAERETAYAVTRCYFSVVYAREQERVARGVVEGP